MSIPGMRCNEACIRYIKELTTEIEAQKGLISDLECDVHFWKTKVKDAVEEEKECIWTKTIMNNYGEYDCWATTCGEDFAICEEWHETPTKFCSNCGGKTAIGEQE